MKRVICALLVAMLCLTFVAGCSDKEDGPLYSYDDLSEYVKIGKVVGHEYTFTVEEVTQEAIDDFIKEALSNNGYGGETLQVKDRAAKNGDTVNIDYVGKKDGVAFQGGTAQGQDLVLGSGSFIDGFEAGLVGVTPGSTVNLDLTFPKNYHSAELAGAAVVFEVKVNFIKEKLYPELTDEIVAEISDCSTVEEYEEYVNGQVLANNQDAAVTNAENALWKSVVDGTKVKKIPEREIDYFSDYLRDAEESNAASGGMTLEQYYDYLGMTEEQFEKEIRTLGEEYAEYYLINVAIARDQDIDVTDDEYKKAIEDYASKNHYATIKEAEDAIDVELFRLSLVSEKVLNYIVENAVQKGEK